MTDGEVTRSRYLKIERESARGEFWLERRALKVHVFQTYTVSTVEGSRSGGRGGWSWNACSRPDCLAEALSEGECCFVHADPGRRQSHLATIADTAGRLSLNGAMVAQHDWDEIAESPIFAAKVVRAELMLIGAEISALLRISNTTFLNSIDLTGATFSEVRVNNCDMRGSVRCRFGRVPNAVMQWHECKFGQEVDFTFFQNTEQSLAFTSCEFESKFAANASHAKWMIRDSVFDGDAVFRGSQGILDLSGSEFRRGIDVSEVDCQSFNGLRIKVASESRLGPLKANSMTLASAEFGQRVHIDVEATEVDLRGAELRAGGLLHVNASVLRLENVTVGGPLKVVGDPIRKAAVWGFLNTDAGLMTLSYVDLQRCSFYGAHGVSAIEVDTTCSLPKPPWWARGRRVIADEFAWRATRSILKYGWTLEGVEISVKAPEPRKGVPRKVLLRPLRPEQVGAIYRELRRSLESKSDMSAAADFYYGEMEMRKWSATGLERFLLWAYWLVSGYGLRPERAIACWIALVGLASWGTYALQAFGSFKEALVFAARAAVPGVANLKPPTIAAVSIVEIHLRVLGPSLLGLLFLALRAKLMRKPSE